MTKKSSRVGNRTRGMAEWMGIGVYLTVLSLRMDAEGGSGCTPGIGAERVSGESCCLQGGDLDERPGKRNLRSNHNIASVLDVKTRPPGFHPQLTGAACREL